MKKTDVIKTVHNDLEMGICGFSIEESKTFAAYVTRLEDLLEQSRYQCMRAQKERDQKISALLHVGSRTAILHRKLYDTEKDRYYWKRRAMDKGKEA